MKKEKWDKEKLKVPIVIKRIKERRRGNIQGRDQWLGSHLLSSQEPLRHKPPRHSKIHLA